MATSNLRSADAEVLDTLRATLPPTCLRDASDADLEDPRGTFRGQAAAVLTPSSVEETAKIVQIAGAARCPLVPHGGGTGLVGGQVLPEGPVPLVISMERMSRIRAVYPEENVLVAEAGAVLVSVQDAADAAGRLFPLSLASEGSAQIGGLLGTNAGGVNVLRYGNARELCLGLEVVLPSSEIWHGLRRLRKDNTGYDLRNLMIGSEGTLGVITAASLRLFPRPSRTGAALLIVPGPAEALRLLAISQAQVAEGVSAFELISGQGLRFLAETMPQVRLPFPEPPDWMVLVDLGLSAGEDPEEALATIFEAALAEGCATDGIVAQSESQRQEFWTVRESLPEANRHIGAIASHDISLPVSRIAEFIETAQADLGQLGAYRINCFGHLGDGNLHFNVFPLPGQTKSDRISERPAVMRCVHDLVAAFEGSFSAEHGVGRLKAGDLARYGDPAKLGAMRAIKVALDPIGIMNPGAVL